MEKEIDTSAQKRAHTASPARLITRCALFAALIAVGAFIRVPIPLVPFTMQTYFVMLAGMLLGPKLGALSAAVYMCLGLAGVPVFTEGGGIYYIFKPTFGYIIGFVVGAWLTGMIAAGMPSYRRLVGAGFAGLGAIYFCGMAYYYVLSRVYLHNPIGLWPLVLHFFLMVIPGDIALCFVASATALALKKRIK